MPRKLRPKEDERKIVEVVNKFFEILNQVLSTVTFALVFVCIILFIVSMWRNNLDNSVVYLAGALTFTVINVLS